MADQDAYRRYTANAEKLLAEVHEGGQTPATAIACVQSAGVWATLALAAAQDRVIPTNRPITGQPETVRDGEGDTWHLKSNGLYAMSGNTKGETSLETIGAAYNGYTEVT